ncbi:prepilin peptidase [Solimonas sp. K1W22B-7]|uniref:prepilin peptidase n=1 Tax=Solimonas sp. K1W22B-7 TaxID=2303331 RepID=UPI000E32E3C1|nr:A24 family peptidase [Solimonas sp. K1W22B-7]AXQ30626.1 prepilin peptidase [Solimonas sp. K1W22B-7]
MTLIEGLQASPGLLIFFCGLVGLVVGSFLNVVILRLPRMLEIGWKRECREMLELPPEPAEKLSLLSPPSRCPSCGTGIKPWHNVPVVGWLILRGRCAGCSAAISPQYPLVEAATALLSGVCAWHFGWGPQLAGALVLTWALVTLTVIDLRTMLLPDIITLPLLWLGLLLALQPVFTDLPSAVIGAAAGYLSLWSIYHLFRILTGKEGMGYGDFKLLAALGAWMGWAALPGTILLSSVVGAVVGIGMIVLRGRDRQLPIPFGPYLAAAGWLWLIWGDTIKAAYLSTY